MTDHARGKGLFGKIFKHMAVWLHENKQSKCLHSCLFGVYALKSFLREGHKIIETIYFDEFEYNGVKVFKDVKPLPYYIDGRPAAYMFSYETNDETVMKEQQTDNQ